VTAGTVPKHIGDARHDREVALKLFEDSADAVSPRLHDALAVSRLSLPHIVPAFEADLAKQAGTRPSLVFEYGKGSALRHPARREGIGLAAHAAQSGRDGVSAGQLRRSR
jgi:hypothetical protein